jgi:nucleotide-binding universal stress UspA family protein
MSKKIVCGIDFTAAADQAAALAVRVAQLFGDRLELVHWIPRSPFIHPELVGATLGPLREASTKALGARRDRLAAAASIEITATAEIGDVDERLVERAADPETRLVVLGAPVRREALASLVGSMATRVARQAPCPVLVVPETSVLARGGWAPQRPLKITVAVDLSPATDAALTWLKTLTEVVSCQVEMVHTYRPERENARLGLPWPPHDFDAMLEVNEVLDRELRARIERIWGPAAAPLHLRPGTGTDPALIAAEAESDGADLLVVGTSQHRLGSIGLRAMRAANVPVLCVPGRLAAVPAPELTPVRTLLVPTDQSAFGNAAVLHACRLLAAGGGTLVVCHAIDGSRPAPPRSPDEIRQELLALVPAEAMRRGIRVRTFVQESGPPAAAIVQAARRLGCDGIVMSSHGHSGLRGALMGSVAEAVVREAPVPVTVISARTTAAGA